MKTKRLLSWLLVMTLCFSLLPFDVTVAAATEAVTFTALEGTAGANEREGYEKLIDGKKTAADGTKWGVSYFSGAYIVMRASKAVVITGYTFTTGDDNTTSTGRNPKDWVLYGSNDYNETDKTATWTAVHTVTNDTTMQDRNYASYSFAVDDNNTAYRYYKLHITANRGSTFMQLSEMELSWREAVTFTPIDATAKDVDSSYNNMFDGKKTADDGTIWRVPDYSSNIFVVMKASKNVIITGYTFTTGNEFSGRACWSNPKDWVLYGSNDYDEAAKSGTWLPIHTVTNDNTLQEADFTSYPFSMADNNTAYRYYKLEISNNHGGFYTQLAEVEMSWKEVNLTALDGTVNSNKMEQNYDKLIDGNINTKWCYSISAQPYIVMRADSPIVVTGYRFTTADDNATTAASKRNPKDWALYGSNDYNESTKSGTWTVIDQKTGNTTMQDVNYTPYDFFVNNLTPYTYYKLQLTASQGNAMMQLSEMELYYQTEPFSVITFDKNGGDTEAEPRQKLTRSGLPTTEPTRRGYLFQGWFFKDGEGALAGRYDGVTTQSDDITVYAKWQPIYITYDKNGGDTEPEPQRDEFLSGLPTVAPTRANYTFVGWYTKNGENDDWGEAFSTASTVTADTTVYARWRVSDMLNYAISTPQAVVGKQHTRFYLGHYPQTLLGDTVPTSGIENKDWKIGVKNGTNYYFKIEPILWRLLGKTDTTALAIADQCLDVMYYTSNADNVSYGTSMLRSFLNGYGATTNQDGIDFTQNNNFVDEAFSALEKSIMPLRNLGTDAMSGVINDRIFTLRYDEANSADYGMGTIPERKSTATDFAEYGGLNRRLPDVNTQTWVTYNDLQVLGDNSLDGIALAGHHFSFGRHTMDNRNMYVRPALNLDLESVVLFSELNSGKPTGGFQRVPFRLDDTEYKLTLKDSNRADFSASYEVTDGKNIQISYENAKTGNNEYVTAVVKNGDMIRYYGQMKNLTTTADTSGSLTIPLPNDFDYFTGDRLYVFNEQVNSGYDYDLSSAMHEILIMSQVPLITFDTNGGETESDQQIIYFGGGLPRVNPTKENCEFLGWYTQNGEDGEWGEEFTDESIPTENMTVYARWDEINITFDENGGTIAAVPRVVIVGGALPTEDPRWPGHIFEGWYTQNGTEDGNWGEAFTTTANITTDTTVYAKWRTVKLTPQKRNFSLLEGTANSNYYENYEKLMDGKKTASNFSKWCLTNFSEAYVVIKASEPVYLSGYTFTTGNDNATNTGRNPKSWTFYGCNDYNTSTKTGSWTEIKKVSNDTTMQDVNYRAYSFSIANNRTQYQYYKLVITANQGSDVLQLAELELDYDTCPHTWTLTYSAPSCTDEGHWLHKCTLCEGSYRQLTNEASLGHIMDSTGTCSRCHVTAAAQIGDVKYIELQTAIDAADAGDTVKLLRDAAIEQALTINKPLTLDLNSYTITQTAKERVITLSDAYELRQITITDSSAAKTGTITGGTSSQAGGGIYVGQGVELYLTNVTIQNCMTSSPSAALDGGGIYATLNTSLIISGSTIKNCSAYKGGGIYISGAKSISITDSLFSDNSAGNDGGAIGMYNSPSTITNTTIKNNTARCGGGIAYINTSATHTLNSGTIFEGNQAQRTTTTIGESMGGAISLGSGMLNVNSGVIIRENTAPSGGGICVFNNSSSCSTLLNINEGAVIQSNTATAYGGGIHSIDSGTVQINGGEIKQNQALCGGGVYVKQASCSISGGSITQNKACLDENTKGMGGGIYVTTNATLTATGGEVKNNIAEAEGGGIYQTHDASTIQLAGMTISGNSAATKGGGVLVNTSGLTIDRGTTISANTLTAAAGATPVISNLYLPTGLVVTATDSSATSGTESEATGTTLPATLVGVTLASGTGNITAAGEADLSSYFKSDLDRYAVTYSDGVVKLAAPTMSLTSEALVTTNVPDGATVFVAAYNGTKLLGLYRATATNGTTDVSSMGLTLTGADRLAAFMLNDRLTPLCAMADISLSESE